MLSTTATYQLISRDLDRSLTNTATNTFVARETSYYLDKIERIKSPDELLNDTRVLNFALRAFNLEHMGYAKAFLKKVLVEGVDRPDSFANTQTDPRYRELAETFNFARYGETATVFEKTRQGVVDRYVRNTLEANAGQSDKGVELALYFERKAGSIESSYSILADNNLRQVVLTAFNLSPSVAALDIDRQAAMLDRLVDFSTFKDPEKLSKFLTRFTALWQASNPQGIQTGQGIVPIVTGSSLSVISSSVLSSLQQLKLGGR